MSFYIILDIFQYIENSVTFCKLKTLHPSIIKSHDLISELKKISRHFENQLPFKLNGNNILEIESIMKVNCKDSSKIVYLLTFPLNYEIDFELFYLLPIPTYYESEFVTIIPENKYFLKSKDKIKPLKDICIGSKAYQCPSQLISHHKSTCEEKILLEGNSKFCEVTKLKITENHLDMVREINQYLAVFPNKERVEIKCQTEKQTKVLKGIFLIKQNNCDLFYKNEEVIYQEISVGQPNIISDVLLKPKIEEISNFSIELKTLKLKELNLNPTVPLQKSHNNILLPSIWTSILYFGLLVSLCYIIIKSVSSKISQASSRKKKSNSEANDIGLPDGATF